jgi:hypothetical protein
MWGLGMECDSHCVATAYLMALIAAILGTTIYCTVFLSIERRPVPRPRRKRVAPRPEIPSTVRGAAPVARDSAPCRKPQAAERKATVTEATRESLRRPVSQPAVRGIPAPAPKRPVPAPRRTVQTLRGDEARLQAPLQSQATFEHKTEVLRRREDRDALAVRSSSLWAAAVQRMEEEEGAPGGEFLDCRAAGRCRGDGNDAVFCVYR